MGMVDQAVVDGHRLIAAATVESQPMALPLRRGQDMELAPDPVAKGVHGGDDPRIGGGGPAAPEGVGEHITLQPQLQLVIGVLHLAAAAGRDVGAGRADPLGAA